MGIKGIEIVGMDVKQLLDLLNKAFADEWFAYYQYWLGAKVVKGPMKEAVIAELLQHATDELRHADLVAGRIIQLGGTPVTEPKKWYDLTSCGYDAPNDPFVEKILEQNIKGERCAIGFYKQLLDATQGKDPVTYNMVLQILQDEVAHEQDLQSLSEDVEVMLKRYYSRALDRHKRYERKDDSTAKKGRKILRRLPAVRLPTINGIFGRRIFGPHILSL